MKLVDLACPKCGAALQVNPDLKIITCNYCGNQFALDDEVVHHRIDNAAQAGYEFEQGRRAAQQGPMTAGERARIKEDELLRMQARAEAVARANVSPKKKLLCIILCLIPIVFFVIIAESRDANPQLASLLSPMILTTGFCAFYTGRIKRGLVYTITIGGLMVCLVWDLIKLLFNSYTDSKGRPVIY